MSINEYKELKKDIAILADRSGMCENKIDKEIMSKVAGHLLNYSYFVSREVEE